MTTTATDLTREHYLRPEVKEIIGKYAMPGDGAWRALNGDFHHWYGYLEDGRARLLHSGDYDDLTERHRTLYQTLNIFEPALREIARPREEISSDNPLGSPADTVAYSLGVDIDKGPGCDIEAPEVKQAVEDAARFLVDYLKEHGIQECIWLLFSGGGIYLHLHHDICRPASLNPGDRAEFFRALTDRFNRLIAHASEEFFKAHPEYIGKVKYDALNNSKRVFKCILSTHKKKPYAVTPLNRDSIKIDFDRARIPLRDDMIAEARAWYSTYSEAEREPLLRLLDEFMPDDDEGRKDSRQFKEIWRSPFKVDPKYFPPCIRHLVNTANLGEGKTRFSAVLSTFLFQAGWPEEEAWNLVKAVSDRNGLDNADHIFDSCFGRISCPSCQKIQTDAAGYPHLGLKGLGACEPLEECGQWPGDYAIFFALGDVRAATKERELKAPEISEEELKDLPKSFNPRLDLHLEPSNFISKYIEYAKTTSDAYEEYHFASGLVLLSVAADRQIVISLRHGDIYPNIWIFPIGDSTISRKTTAHRLCKLILKTKYPKKSLPSSFSPEALMDAISSTPRCFYLKDEAGSLLASLCKDYMAETRDFLAEIYECDDYYRKLKKSECIITDPYITQYLMTTPDNLKEYTTPLDLTSGWLLRYLWMYPNYPKEWRAFAEKDGSDFEKYTTIYGEYNLVVEKLATPRRLSMTAESMQFFQEWQRGIEEAAMKNADNITKALAGRLMTHAVKMAALFTVGREDFDENSKIELPHIREAASMVVEYFLPIGRIIIEEVARAESKNVQDKIIGTIKRYNGLVKQRDLLRALHMRVKEVDESIEALILSEEIERQIVNGKKGIVLYYKLRECHSELVSHKVVYKENNEGGLYTPACGTKPLCQMGQDRIKDAGGEKTGIGPHPRRDMSTSGIEEIRFLARFRTEYTTQWPRGGGRYEPITYQEGEECVAPLERALQWKGRGVVDLVEIVLPWEPPQEATA